MIAIRVESSWFHAPQTFSKRKHRNWQLEVRKISPVTPYTVITDLNSLKAKNNSALWRDGKGKRERHKGSKGIGGTEFTEMEGEGPQTKFIQWPHVPRDALLSTQAYPDIPDITRNVALDWVVFTKQAVLLRTQNILKHHVWGPWRGSADPLHCMVCRGGSYVGPWWHWSGSGSPGIPVSRLQNSPPPREVRIFPKIPVIKITTLHHHVSNILFN